MRSAGIGNDVVDLSRSDARGKARDVRFMRRVFTASEAALIRSAPEPGRTLWMLWAAKEAAFKVVQKQDGAALFAHRSYEVQVSEEPDMERARGTVTIDSTSGEPWSLPVEWSLGARMVHCLALGRPSQAGDVRSAVAEITPSAGATSADASWTERELLSARSTESREARLLAKRLAFEAGLGAVEVVRWPGARRFGPPLLYAQGAPEPIGGWHPTLSHDGAFVAAALCRVGG